MAKRFKVQRGVACWLLVQRNNLAIVQSFATGRDAFMWARLANHPHAVLDWSGNGHLIGVDIAVATSNNGNR